MVTRVPVSANQIAVAKATIQRAIEAGRNGTDVDLTATGVLAHVLMDLGVALDVSIPNQGE